MLDQVCELVLQQTSSFGVRWHQLQRQLMQRSFTKVMTKFGELSLKIGQKGQFKKVAVEYDEAARIARKNGLSVAEVMQQALQVYDKKSMR